MFAPRDLNVTTDTPGATATRRILTPWPFVLGQLIVTCATYVYQMLVATEATPSRIKWAILHVINVVRGAGAAAWMLLDITYGGAVPSIGVAQMLLNLTLSSDAHGPIHSVGFFEAVLKVIGYTVAILGFGVYITDGVLSIVHYSFSDPLITVVVTRGCPNGIKWSWTHPNSFECPTVKPHYTYSDKSSSTDFPQILWVMGGIYGLTVLSLALTYANHNANHPRVLYNNRALLKSGLLINLFGGALAVIANAVSVGASQENYYDCRNARLVGNVYVGCQQAKLLVPAAYQASGTCGCNTTKKLFAPFSYGNWSMVL